jgi:DNA-binding CsgD family transcriptional regulator
MYRTFYSKYKHTLLYGAALAVLLFLLKWLQWRFIIIDLSIEIYIGVIALMFTILGIWLAQKLARPGIKTVVIEKEVYLPAPVEFTPDENALNRLTLSKREMEVLQLMAEGLSNEEIATRLFVSLSTIKTHNSRLFEKMDVRRRTQAIEKAKRLKIIP